MSEQQKVETIKEELTEDSYTKEEEDVKPDVIDPADIKPEDLNYPNLAMLNQLTQFFKSQQLLESRLKQGLIDVKLETEDINTLGEIPDLDDSSSGSVKFKIPDAEGRFSCDKCPYSAISKTTLKRHVESKHEGVRYPCDQCEYSSVKSWSLKKHKEAKHGGVSYSCADCDFVAPTAASLKTHNKAQHTGKDS